MNMDSISIRFNELFEQGQILVSRMCAGRKAGELKFNWVPNDCIVEYQSWVLSAVNLVHIIVLEDNIFAMQCNDLMALEKSRGRISSPFFLRIFGLFSSAKDEWEKGLLKKIEFIVAGATFDKFLDHASDYHRGGKKTESSVLASAVLEDTV